MIRTSKGFVLIFSLGMVLLSLGAGMRVLANVAIRQREASLLAARPMDPHQQSSIPDSDSIPPAHSAPISISIPEMGSWNQISPADVLISWENGTPKHTWKVDDAGWYDLSGLPGWGRNVVIGGHSPALDPTVWERSIFRDLAFLQPGDVIEVGTAEGVYQYQVAQVFAIPAEQAHTESAAVWLSDTGDERLTLLTCFPPHTAATRVLVIAFPIGWRNHEP